VAFAAQQTQLPDVCFGSKAGIVPCGTDVRFTPNSDRLLRRREMTLCAISDQSAVQQNAR
jgi:hypothetical protein